MKFFKDEATEANPAAEPVSEIDAADNAPADPKDVGDQLDGGGPASGI